MLGDKSIAHRQSTDDLWDHLLFFWFHDAPDVDQKCINYILIQLLLSYHMTRSGKIICSGRELGGNFRLYSITVYHQHAEISLFFQLLVY